MKNQKILLLLIIVSLLCLLVSIGLYIYAFHGGLSTDRDDWMIFGTFFGGVLSPIFSFLSFIAVIIIFQHEMQQKEQEEDNKEIMQLLELLNRSYHNIEAYEEHPDKKTEMIHYTPSQLFEFIEGYILNLNVAYLDLDNIPFKQEREDNKDNIKKELLKNASQYLRIKEYLDSYLRTILYILKEISSKKDKDKYIKLLNGQISVSIMRIFVITYYSHIINDINVLEIVKNIHDKYQEQWFSIGKNVNNFFDKYNDF